MNHPPQGDDALWHVLVSDSGNTTAYLITAATAPIAAAIAASRHAAAEGIADSAINSVDASRWQG